MRLFVQKIWTSQPRGWGWRRGLGAGRGAVGGWDGGPGHLVAWADGRIPEAAVLAAAPTAAEQRGRPAPGAPPGRGSLAASPRRRRCAGRMRSAQRCCQAGGRRGRGGGRRVGCGEGRALSRGLGALCCAAVVHPAGCWERWLTGGRTRGQQGGSARGRQRSMLPEYPALELPPMTHP